MFLLFVIATLELFLRRRSIAWSGIGPAPDVVDHPVLYAIIYVIVTALHPEYVSATETGVKQLS